MTRATAFKTEKIELSPIKRIQARAEELGAVSLAQGIPKFLPPLRVRRVASAAIEQGKADFYGPPQGIDLLRKEIAARHLAEEGARYDPNSEVLVTAGALQGMVAAFLSFLLPGDELIVPSPSYFPFLHLPKVLGIKPVFAPLKPPEFATKPREFSDGWRLDIPALKRSITPRTAGILLVHPNNPTGTVYKEKELEEIMRLAKKHDLFVFVDEVYRYFVYDGDYPSLGKFAQYRDRVVRMMSFSKAFSLSGWRIGYLLADKRLTAEILKVHEMLVTASASLPAQYAALAALSEFPDLPRDFANLLEGRKKRMRRRLDKLSSVFEAPSPSGAYYFFAKLSDGRDDRDFCERLLEEAGVALVPGSTFGREGRGFVRLSFAATEGEIDEAFDRMERYLLKAEPPSHSFEKILNGAVGVTDDSRSVKRGEVFVAVRGAEYDGHDFIPDAIKRGAIRIVGERDLDYENYVKVKNSRRALGLLSSAWHGNPSSRLKVIGVTGTDGKTTTSHLLNAILREAGFRSAVLSTLNAPGAHTTTPSAPVLQDWLAGEVREGTEVAVLEVTSHAIAQERIAGIRFAGAVLTNITPEHLDYHETFARYRDTKARLFRAADLSVLNKDDGSFEPVSRVSGSCVVSYGLSSRADFRAVNARDGRSGCRFSLAHDGKDVSVRIPLRGEFNVLNSLAAATAASSLFGVDLSTVKRGLENFDPSSLVGRFEEIDEISDRAVVVDFAHTPNALAKVLNYAARVKPANSRLLVVFGCAGKRDRLKRPEMGKIAARTADFVVLTSEDPRDEDPEKIIDEIAHGCFAEGAVEGKNFVRVPDRRLAIRFALERARPGDYLLVLGKGHEPTMAIGGKEYPWSDHRVIKEEWQSIRI